MSASEDKKVISSITGEAGYSYIFHSSEFTVYDKLINCGNYSKGTGSAFNLGINIDKEFYGGTYFSLGINYLKSKNELINERTFQSRDTINGGLINIKTNTIIENKIDFLGISPSVKFKLLNNFISGPLFFNLGSDILINLTNSYIQYERIIEPSNAVFTLNGLRSQSRDLSSGSIATFNLPIVTINTSLENLIKIGNNKWFTQKLAVNYTLNNYITDVDKWKSLGINLSLGIRFDFIETKEEIKPQIKDTVRYIEPILSENKVNLTQNIIKDKKEEIKIVEPEVKFDLSYSDFVGEITYGNEYVSTLPLVNAVFFKTNYAIIPNKYSQKYTKNISMFNGDAIDFHKNILIISALKLADNSKAYIELEGSSSGSKNERNCEELAKQRAESVKKSLINLGVPKEKIKLSYSEMPKIPSNQEFSGGIEENQRVTINIKNEHSLDYISLQKFSNIAGKSSINILVDNLKKSDQLFLKNNIPSIDQRIYNSQKIYLNLNYKMDDEVFKNLLSKGDKINVESSLILNDNSVKNFSYILDLNKIKRRNIETTFDNFDAVIRFDYNSSKLSEDNKNLIQELIKLLPENSKIDIYGSADELGSEKRNKVLSQERAEKASSFIQKESKKKFEINLKDATEKFPESTPEGRFLNRSIRIRIEK